MSRQQDLSTPGECNQKNTSVVWTFSPGVAPLLTESDLHEVLGRLHQSARINGKGRKKRLANSDPYVSAKMASTLIPGWNTNRYGRTSAEKFDTLIRCKQLKGCFYRGRDGRVYIDPKGVARRRKELGIPKKWVSASARKKAQKAFDNSRKIYKNSMSTDINLVMEYFDADHYEHRYTTRAETFDNLGRMKKSDRLLMQRAAAPGMYIVAFDQSSAYYSNLSSYMGDGDMIEELGTFEKTPEFKKIFNCMGYMTVKHGEEYTWNNWWEKGKSNHIMYLARAMGANASSEEMRMIHRAGKVVMEFTERLAHAAKETGVYKWRTPFDLMNQIYADAERNVMKIMQEEVRKLGGKFLSKEGDGCTIALTTEQVKNGAIEAIQQEIKKHNINIKSEILHNPTTKTTIITRTNTTNHKPQTTNTVYSKDDSVKDSSTCSTPLDGHNLEGQRSLNDFDQLQSDLFQDYCLEWSPHRSTGPPN